MSTAERFLIGSWFLVIGHWFLVLGSWFLIILSRCPRLHLRHRVNEVMRRGQVAQQHRRFAKAQCIRQPAHRLHRRGDVFGVAAVHVAAHEAGQIVAQ